jgi:hypothetical protein
VDEEDREREEDDDHHYEKEIGHAPVVLLPLGVVNASDGTRTVGRDLLTCS